jgi:D-serine deaminase-like pyridoxal phosphate-dependent protein
MSILATVQSVSGAERAVLDAGSKTLALDMLRPRPDGYGLVIGTESRLTSLSEEHGIVAVARGDAFKIGQRVRVLPNHACVVSNLHDRVYGVRGETVEAVFEVAARGCVY